MFNRDIFTHILSNLTLIECAGIERSRAIVEIMIAPGLMGSNYNSKLMWFTYINESILLVWRYYGVLPFYFAASGRAVLLYSMYQHDGLVSTTISLCFASWCINYLSNVSVCCHTCIIIGVRRGGLLSSELVNSSCFAHMFHLSCIF